MSDTVERTGKDLSSMAVTLSRVLIRRREKTTSLPLYYTGYLLKKCTVEKDFNHFFGELRGSTIFLYADDTHDTYSERVELENLVVMDSTKTKNGLTVFTLTLRQEEIQLKIENPDTAEEWRGFIMTVAKREVPSRLQLLPGQMMRLEEVLEKERHRTAPPLPLQPITNGLSRFQHSPLPPIPSVSTETYENIFTTVPSSFFAVSRQDAELMLAQNPKNGNIILRLANDNVNYAITVRQDYNSGPVMKHFKVRTEKSGFVIEFDEPVTVPSLKDVVDYFVKISAQSLRPYNQAEDYDSRIEVAPNPPASLPRLPVVRTVPRIRASWSPPTIPRCFLIRKPLEEESEYLYPDLTKQDSAVLGEKLPQSGQVRKKHQQAHE